MGTWNLPSALNEVSWKHFANDSQSQRFVCHAPHLVKEHVGFNCNEPKGDESTGGVAASAQRLTQLLLA